MNDTQKGVGTKIEIPLQLNTALRMIGLNEDKTKNQVMLDAMEFYAKHKGVLKC